MTNKQIENMILDLFSHEDYDIYKELLTEDEQEELSELVKIARKHLEHE